MPLIRPHWYQEEDLKTRGCDYRHARQPINQELRTRYLLHRFDAENPATRKALDHTDFQLSAAQSRALFR